MSALVGNLNQVDTIVGGSIESRDISIGVGTFLMSEAENAVSKSALELVWHVL